MPVTMKELGIDTLCPEDLRALAQEILDTLGEDRPPSRLSPQRSAELWRRDAAMDADPSIALTWDQIRTRIETKLRGEPQ